MILPGASLVLAAMDATWPPLGSFEEGPFRLRRGAGGGKRVSAASLEGAFDGGAIARAEEGMRGIGQTPLFVLGPRDAALDRALAARGYEVLDPVTLLARETAAGPLPPRASVSDPGPARLWDEGGIGPERREVMARVCGAKAVLCLPDADAPEAAVFVARGGQGAMLHALHVEAASRRRGLGRDLTIGALAWAAAERCGWLALAVTDANGPANALYASLGFKPVGRYWYRSLGE